MAKRRIRGRGIFLGQGERLVCGICGTLLCRGERFGRKRVKMCLPCYMMLARGRLAGGLSQSDYDRRDAQTARRSHCIRDGRCKLGVPTDDLPR